MSRVKYENHNNYVANRTFFIFQDNDCCLYACVRETVCMYYYVCDNVRLPMDAPSQNLETTCQACSIS